MDMQSVLDRLLAARTVSCRHLAKHFHRLPSRKELPLYYDFIKYPIDFDTIQAKIKTNQYGGSLQPFFIDVDMLCENALFFNEQNSPVYEAALALKALSSKEQRLAVQQGFLIPIPKKRGRKKKNPEAPELLTATALDNSYSAARIYRNMKAASREALADRDNVETPYGAFAQEIKAVAGVRPGSIRTRRFNQELARQWNTMPQEQRYRFQVQAFCNRKSRESKERVDWTDPAPINIAAHFALLADVLHMTSQMTNSADDLCDSLLDSMVLVLPMLTSLLEATDSPEAPIAWGFTQAEPMLFPGVMASQPPARIFGTQDMASTSGSGLPQQGGSSMQPQGNSL
jgi:hypothetical protein